MIVLLSAVLVASLLGSVHCAGMCGAFVAFAVTPMDARERRGVLPHAAYQGGRLATYVAMGLIAGVVGASIDFGGSLVGVQRAAASLAGAMMVVVGIFPLLRVVGVRVPEFRAPARVQQVTIAGHRRAATLSQGARALATGLLTTLLPCGWLYAFVITAAGTGHPISGALVMAVFWVGTLPVLVAIGAGAQSLAGPVRRLVPALVSILLCAAGVWNLVGRMAAPAIAVVPDLVHSAATVGHVRTMTPKDCPVCHGD